MNFKELKIKGAFLIYNKKKIDKRGNFSRLYCENIFKKKKLNTHWVQFNNSYNKKKYTFRGFHFQKYPSEEIKIVICFKGKIIDILLDLRKKSKTYLNLCYIQLSDNINNMVYIPKGVAHGFLTLKNNTKIFYMHSKPYCKKNYCTISILDKDINCKIKKKIKIISKRDELGNYKILK
jgi:dTDP-4-dehydrorhamnose 3,5-epimerase